MRGLFLALVGLFSLAVLAFGASGGLEIAAEGAIGGARTVALADPSAARLASQKHLARAQKNAATLRARLLLAQQKQANITADERKLQQDIGNLQHDQDLLQTQLNTLAATSSARDRLRASVKAEVAGLGKQLKKLQEKIRQSRDKEIELLTRALDRGVVTRALGEEQRVLLHDVSDAVSSISADKTALQAANTTLGTVDGDFQSVQQAADQQHQQDLSSLSLLTKQRKAAMDELSKQTENKRTVDAAAARIRGTNIALVKAVDDIIKRRDSIRAKRDSLRRSVILLNVVVRQLAEAVKSQKQELSDSQRELQRAEKLDKQRSGENDAVAGFTKTLNMESEELTQQVKKLKGSLPVMEQRLTNLTRLRDAFATSLAKVKQEVIGEESIVENLKAARSKLRAHLLVAKSRIAAIKRDVRRLSDKIKEKRGDKKEMKEELQRLGKRTKVILSRIGGIQEKLEDAEGKAKAAWLQRRGECQCDELQFAGAGESAIAACMKECGNAVVVAEAALLELTTDRVGHSDSEEAQAEQQHEASSALSEAVSRSRDALRSSLASDAAATTTTTRSNPFRFASADLAADLAASEDGAAEERSLMMKLSELAASLDAAGAKVSALLSSSSSTSAAGASSGGNSLPETIERLARKVSSQMKTANEERLLMEALQMVEASSSSPTSTSTSSGAALPRFASADMDMEMDADLESESEMEAEMESLSRSDILSSGDPIAAMTEAEARSTEAKSSMLKREVAAKESEAREALARVQALAHNKAQLSATVAALQQQVSKAQFAAAVESGDFSKVAAASKPKPAASGGDDDAGADSSSPSSPAPQNATAALASLAVTDPLIRAATQQATALRASVDLLSKQLGESSSRVSSMKVALSAADAEFARLKKDVERLKRTKVALANQKANLERTIATTLKAIRVRRAETMKSRDELKSSRDKAAREQTKAREELAEATREAQALSTYYAFMSKANAALSAHVESLRTRKANLMTSEEAVNAEITAADQNLKKLLQRQTNLLAATAKTAKALSDTKAELAKVSAELSAEDIRRGKLHQQNQDAASKRDKLRSDQLHYQEKVSSLRRQLLSQLRRTKDVNTTLSEAKADLAETLKMRRALVASVVNIQRGLKETNTTLVESRAQRAASEALLLALTKEVESTKDQLLKKRRDLRKTMASYRDLLASSTHGHHVDLSVPSKKDARSLMSPEDRFEEKRAIAESEAKLQQGNYEPSEQWKEVLGAASDLMVEEDAPPVEGEIQE